MAGSPKWKVYTPEGKYEAACKHAETAAVVVSFLGRGAKVTLDHGRVVWREGTDGIAFSSYDVAAETMHRNAGLI